MCNCCILWFSVSKAELYFYSAESQIHLFFLSLSPCSRAVWECVAAVLSVTHEGNPPFYLIFDSLFCCRPRPFHHSLPLSPPLSASLFVFKCLWSPVFSRLSFFISHFLCPDFHVSFQAPSHSFPFIFIC